MWCAYTYKPTYESSRVDGIIHDNKRHVQHEIATQHEIHNTRVQTIIFKVNYQKLCAR